MSTEHTELHGKSELKILIENALQCGAFGEQLLGDRPEGLEIQQKIMTRPEGYNQKLKIRDHPRNLRF